MSVRTGTTACLDDEILNYGGAEALFEHDANGNLTKKTLASGEWWDYVYDTENRLVEVRKDGVTIAKYRYDPFGRRLWKDVSADGITSTRTFYHYNLEGLDGEYDFDGTEPVELRTYGYLPGSNWTTDPLFLKEGADYYWYLNDHLGTPKKLVDDSGEVFWSATHDAFGKANIEAITIENNLPIVNNLRFPGQYHDDETGLHYNFHRYYDPETGRYLSVDPLRDGVNWYVYAAGNSNTFIDSVGTDTLEIGTSGDLGSGYGVTGGYRIVLDTDGNIAIVRNYGGGVHMGANASGSLIVQYTNTNNVHSLVESPSVNTGGSATYVAVGFTGGAIDGGDYGGVYWGLSVGPGTPLEFHVNTEWSDIVYLLTLQEALGPLYEFADWLNEINDSYWKDNDNECPR